VNARRSCEGRRNRGLAWSMVAALAGAAVCCAPPVFSADEYTFLLDRRHSMVIGARNLVTIQRGLSVAEDRWLGTAWFDEAGASRKTAGILGRMAKTVLVDNVVDHMTYLVQHEVFGHGARYREFGFTDNDYNLNPPSPYGNGGGWAARGPRTSGRRTGADEYVAMTIGGSEANAAVARVLRQDVLRRRAVTYREAVLYLMTSHDLTAYILSTEFGWKEKPGNDVRSFLEQVNRRAARPGYQVDGEIKLGDLARESLLNFLDPLQMVAVYTYFVPYLWRGERTCTVPTLRLGPVRCLPRARIALAPWGTEWYLEGAFVGSERLTDAYVRRGFGPFYESTGAGVTVVDAFSARGFQGDLWIHGWHQPALELGGSELRKTGGGFGCSVGGNLGCAVKQSGPSVRLLAEVAWKSDGFLQGEPLGRGVRVGGGVAVGR
jgi:hypothetical protein